MSQCVSCNCIIVSVCWLQVSFVILVLKHGIQLTSHDIVVLSVGLPFSALWMLLGRTVVNVAYVLLCVHLPVFGDFGYIDIP